MLNIELLPIFEDNYVFILTDSEESFTAVVDPGLSEPVISFLSKRSLGLDAILITHHHHDHVGGIEALVERYACEVYASAKDSHRIPLVTKELSGEQRIDFGPFFVQVLEVPGHTSGHIAYYLPDEKVLFCGDTLFSLGCGRLFEGTAEQLWESLQKLRLLPGETKVYCTHEYTEKNLSFALSIDPNNSDLIAMGESIRVLRLSAQATIPSTMDQEKLCNPFMLVDNPEFRNRILGIDGTKPSPSDLFAQLRLQRNNF